MILVVPNEHILLRSRNAIRPAIARRAEEGKDRPQLEGARLYLKLMDTLYIKMNSSKRLFEYPEIDGVPTDLIQP